MEAASQSDLDQLLDHQIEYYRQRAGEYDDWFYRRGRYDHGSESNQRWWDEVRTIDEALRSVGALGDVLELAAGTGIWTEKLAAQSDSIVAVDSSEEVLRLNRDRLGARSGLRQAAGRAVTPEYEIADLFEWTPTRRFDTVFFSFWLSHVPDAHFDSFWDTVRDSLKPGGRVFFVDSRPADESGARDHVKPDMSGRVRRKLADGAEFEIVKIFYQPDQLAKRLSNSGWVAKVGCTPRFFIYGDAFPVVGEVTRQSPSGLPTSSQQPPPSNRQRV